MTISKHRRERIIGLLLKHQRFRCIYCGEEFDPEVAWMVPTLEHLTPKSKGGGDRIKNLALACLRCNNTRGNGDRPNFHMATMGLKA